MSEDSMFGTLGIWEILLILLVVMLLFGSRKLPEIGRGLGKAITNFKRSVKEPDRIDETQEDEEEEEEPNSSKKSGSSEKK
jgi:sec-independent protein translocase protein TatA